MSRSISPTEDRPHHRRHNRTPSPDSRKRHRREPTAEDEKQLDRAVSDFVEGIAKEYKKKHGDDGGGGGEDVVVAAAEEGAVAIGFEFFCTIGRLIGWFLKKYMTILGTTRVFGSFRRRQSFNRCPVVY